MIPDREERRLQRLRGAQYVYKPYVKTGADIHFTEHIKSRISILEFNFLTQQHHAQHCLSSLQIEELLPLEAVADLPVQAQYEHETLLHRPSAQGPTTPTYLRREGNWMSRARCKYRHLLTVVHDLKARGMFMT